MPCGSVNPSEPCCAKLRTQTTLPAVVDHYDQALGLGLSAADKADLIAYLKAI